MKPGSQFPDLTPASLGERWIDPAILDRPVEIEPVELEAPSLWFIVPAWIAGLALCLALWNGMQA